MSTSDRSNVGGSGVNHTRKGENYSKYQSSAQSLLTEAKERETIVKTLQHPLRAALLEFLAKFESELCVREIADQFPPEFKVTPGQVSHHLGRLKEVELVIREAGPGGTAYYKVDRKLVLKYEDAITSMFLRINPDSNANIEAEER